MAADVNYTFNEEGTNEADNKAAPRSSKKSAPALEPDEPGTANNSSE
jgi:hypothetical protein